MLSSEKQEVIQGCVIYEDYTNPKSFYCLPEETARIADNGRAIQYVVYTDDEVLEGDSPDFDKDESRVGGFLTVQVELGPNDEKFESIRSELQSKRGEDITLSMVPFTDGDVKLVMFGSDGTAAGADDDFSVTIAGSTKPSLQMRQTAVFSTRLSNKPAQIMWNLLKGGSQTQVAVVYGLKYLGVSPAYNLEITVDFKATENFWNHTVGADLGIHNDQINIAASANVDVMIRELMSEGAITVKQVVYADGASQANLLGNDPTGIELVKKLMAPTLFEATAIPSDEQQAAINEAIANRVRDDDHEAGPPPGGEGEPPTEPVPDTGDGRRTEDGVDETTTTDDRTGGGDGEETTDETPGGNGHDTSTGDGTGGTTGETDTETGEGGGTGEGEGTEGGEGSEGGESEGGEREEPGEGDGDADEERTDTTETPHDRPRDGDETPEEEEDDDTEKEKTDSALGIDIKVGYTLRRREISQQVKRKFVFDKAEAKTLNYYPNGALTLEGTAFDVDKQVMLVRLNEGPFKAIELEVRASFDFAEYSIRETVIHISYGFKGAKGDRAQRVHQISMTLDQTKKTDKVKFFVDQYGTLSYDYQVEFIHDSGSIIGTPETKVTSELFLDETVRDLSINMDKHSPLIPVTIQAGELQFEQDGIRSVQVFLAPAKEGNGKTTILNAADSEVKRYLIQPPKKNQYDYFLRKEFFFKDEKLTFEEENVKDSQVVVDRPLARIFSVSPTLANANNLIKQALVDVRYTAADSEIKSTTLNLTPEAEAKSFSILVEEDDPRSWSGRTRFVLNDGRLLEGGWVNYDTEQPFINLDNSGFRTLKVTPLLGAGTFNGRLAALEVTLSSADPARTDSAVLFLNSSKTEDVAIIPNTPVTDALNANIRIFANDGTTEEQTVVVPANTPQLILQITNVN